MKRRQFLATFAAVTLLPAAQAGAQGRTFTLAELEAAKSPLGDIELGAKDAKVVIFEYASMTCGHCASFHEKTFPELKRKYIDTGKVRFILREFPIDPDGDPLSVAAAMLARCSGEANFHGVIELLFKHHRAWTQTNKPVDALFNLVKEVGFTREKFESCLKDQKIYDGVRQTRHMAAKQFGVQSTPTFFINGKMERGALSIHEFDRILAPLLGG